MTESSHDSLMKRLDLFQASCREMSLWGRPLVHANAHKDLSQKREYSRDVIEAGDDGSLPVGLGQIGTWGNVFIIEFFGEVNRAIFISETNGAAEENTHGLVRSKEQPEGSAPDFALDRVQSLVRCFLMKPEGHSNMCSLAKGCVLRRVMALTEVVHTIKVSNHHV